MVTEIILLRVCVGVGGLLNCNIIYGHCPYFSL